MLRIYVLECWTEELYRNRDGMGHDVNCVGVFSDKTTAKKYMAENYNYAGDQDDWFWALTGYYLDEDAEHNDFPVHYTRHGKLQNEKEWTDEEKIQVHKDINEWDIECKHDEQYYLDDEEDDPDDVETPDEEEDPVIVKDGTITVSHPVNTQEDVDEFILRLYGLKDKLPLREEKTPMQKIMEYQTEILKICNEMEKQET